jgi:hypothetical protein
MELIQWSPKNGKLVVSDEYGIINGTLHLCVGDDPGYAKEGYPALSAVPEAQRVIMCMPNATGVWRAWAYRNPYPVVFSVPDESIVYVRRFDEEPRAVVAGDLLRVMQRLFSQTSEGSQFWENFEVIVPLSELPHEQFRRTALRKTTGYMSYHLDCPQSNDTVVASMWMPVSRNIYSYLCQQMGLDIRRSSILKEADRLGIDWGVGRKQDSYHYYRIDAWRINVHVDHIENVQQLLRELEAAIALVKAKDIRREE